MLMIFKSLFLKVHDKGFLTALCPTFILTIDVHLVTLKNLENPLTKLDLTCDAPRSINEPFMTFIDSISQ